MILPFTDRDSVWPLPLADVVNVVAAGKRAFEDAPFKLTKAWNRRCLHATGKCIELLLNRY